MIPCYWLQYTHKEMQNKCIPLNELKLENEESYSGPLILEQISAIELISLEELLETERVIDLSKVDDAITKINVSGEVITDVYSWHQILYRNNHRLRIELGNVIFPFHKKIPTNPNSYRALSSIAMYVDSIEETHKVSFVALSVGQNFTQSPIAGFIETKTGTKNLTASSLFEIENPTYDPKNQIKDMTRMIASAYRRLNCYRTS